MKATTVYFLFLVIVICYGRSAAQLSRAEKQEALDFHNDLRRSEGASDMLCMVTTLYERTWFICIASPIHELLDKSSRKSLRCFACVLVSLLLIS